MKTALIGFSGFVGSNILAQQSFTDQFNSKNIEELRDTSYDLVVCAGVPAVKWWANKNPVEDLRVINTLSDIYRSIKAKRFVLISTVDVYPNPIGVSESAPIDIEAAQPYGKHRLMLEEMLKDNFEHLHTIRLPGLFGQGLKKNILFDMLCNNILEKINLQSSFQWYPLSHIWSHIETAMTNDLDLVNLSVEPILTETIVSRFFPHLAVGSDPFPAAHYDMRSEHHALFDGENGYLLSKDQVLAEMALWLKNPEVNCAK